ncbi:hypothetical protein [Streptomyces mirabilis]|uniref:hypothetical protein n=1 Tax=Streptomyces mirabilis TaxID=68239 RepID=UPI003F699FD4
MDGAVGLLAVRCGVLVDPQGQGGGEVDRAGVVAAQRVIRGADGDPGQEAEDAGGLYAVIPDAVARALAVAAKAGINPEARGAFFESSPHPADSWAAATVRTIFEAVIAVRPEDAEDVSSGLGQYRTWDGGTFYGFIVGESGWDTAARWWRDYERTGDLRVRGNASIAFASRRALAGTCTF